jgi:hypothetical protein
MARATRSTKDDDAPGAADRIDLTGTGDQTEPGAALQYRDSQPEGEVVVGGPAMQTLFNWLVDRASRTDEDDFAQMEASVRRILQGSSAEEVLREDLPISGKTYLDKPFQLHGLTVTETDFAEGGAPFYANLDVTIAGGERRILNVGGIKVLAKLAVIDQEGDYPYFVVLKGHETKKGFTVLDLVQAS